MELPPGPPSLGESSPPPPADRSAEDDVEAAVPEPAEGLLSDEEANRRLVATTAAFALVAVAVMIGVFLLTDRDGGGRDQAAAPAPVVTLPTPTTAEAAPPIDQADLGEVIDRATAFVSEQRGLDFEEDVEVVVLGRQEYEDEVRAAFDSARDEVGGYLTRQAQVYQALGLWPAGSDPVSLARDLRATSTLGFYDHDGGRVVMGVPELGGLFEMTLVHELTHALDDQHFGIDRPELYARRDESAMAFAALVEGDARRVELAYQATLSDEERGQLATDAAAATPGLDPEAFPDVMSIQENWALSNGQTFVQGLVDDGGTAAVDRAFRRVPRTTEEIAEPDTYLDGVPPTAVEMPVPGGPQTGEGIVGQAVLGWLTDLEAPIEGELDEWNGDHYVLWPQGDQICIRFDVVGDARGIGEQLQDWAELASADVTAEDSSLSASTCH